MAARRVLRIDNEEERKLLKAKSVKVKQFDKSLKALVQDMTETMREHNGVGLAAPQIGVLRRVVVIEVPAVEEEREDGTLVEVAPAKLHVMINPEVIEAAEERVTMLEGCLSLPGWYGDVPRPEWVTIRYQDLDGKEHRVKKAGADGYKLGRMAQHEIDHLDGVLFTERIEDLSTLRDITQDNKPRRRGLLRRRPKPITANDES